MADRRKLQAEIDRCLKKVDEGVETFEDIWKKVQSAANINQKEKFESDLKKEIKKLQRLRDQIKTWLTNSDIKDKSSLLEKRKLIETQMERFKVVERETKTKAYSKDGLGAAAKVDPQTKEKSEVTHWLSNIIDSLQMQLDQFESEMESRSGSSKKKNKDAKYEELKQQQDRHKYHIEMLEKVMRHVDNDKLPLDRVRDLRDDLEYFVESNQDPNFQENQYLYDELDLEGLGFGDPAVLATSPNENEDIVVASTPSSTNSSSPSPSPSANSSHSNEKHDDIDRKRHKSQSEEKKGTSPAPIGTSKPASSSSKHSQNNHHPVTPSPLTAYAAAAGAQSNSSSSGSRFPPPTPSVWHRSLSTQSSGSSDSQKSHANSVDHVVTASLTSNSTLLGSTNTNSVSLTSSGNPSVSSAPSPQTSVASSAPTLSTVNSSLSSVVSNSTKGSNGRPEGPPTMNGPLSASGPSLPKSEDLSLRNMAQQAVANAELEKSIPSHPPIDSSNLYVSQAPSQPSVPSLSTSSISASASSDHPSSINLSNPSSHSTTQQPAPPSQQHPGTQQQQQQTPQTNSIHLNPLLGMAPLGPTTITKDQMYQLAMLEAAYHHLPHPSDSERMRNFLPRNPCPTPSYYPSAALPHADQVEFYQRCGTETLFFIFYYMEGTKAQYLAAKALKKQSWRFHTKYMMWFQRHDEPKQITEDFEQGTYIYFDYEKWGQKRKEAFIFEYRYLEDRDLN